jgi:hypothetical protein
MKPIIAAGAGVAGGQVLIDVCRVKPHAATEVPVGGQFLVETLGRIQEAWAISGRPTALQCG